MRTDVMEQQLVKEPKAVCANKNVNWLDCPGSWTFIGVLIFLSWLVISTWVEPGMAWTYVHIGHGIISYYLLHWNKGSPVEADQGEYDRLTFWEQLDDGVQGTAKRKFFITIPVVLFILSSHGCDYRRQPLGLNLIVVLWLTLAKLPALHRVRIMGIGKY
jgi:hypothetical protein